MKGINPKDSCERESQACLRTRREPGEDLEKTQVRHLEAENAGLRRLVIELIAKNQRLREEIRVAKAEA